MEIQITVKQIVQNAEKVSSLNLQALVRMTVELDFSRTKIRNLVINVMKDVLNVVKTDFIVHHATKDFSFSKTNILVWISALNNIWKTKWPMHAIDVQRHVKNVKSNPVYAPNV